MYRARTAVSLSARRQRLKPARRHPSWQSHPAPLEITESRADLDSWNHFSRISAGIDLSMRRRGAESRSGSCGRSGTAGNATPSAIDVGSVLRASSIVERTIILSFGFSTRFVAKPWPGFIPRIGAGLWQPECPAKATQSASGDTKDRLHPAHQDPDSVLSAPMPRWPQVLPGQRRRRGYRRDDPGAAATRPCRRPPAVCNAHDPHPCPRTADAFVTAAGRDVQAGTAAGTTVSSRRPHPESS